MGKRSEKMYAKDKQPHMERDEEDGKMKVKKGVSTGTEKSDKIAAGVDGAVRDGSEGTEGKGVPPHARHTMERMEMHTKHMQEHHTHDHGDHGDKKEMHARHEKEIRAMHTRHESEMTSMDHEKEAGGKAGAMDKPKKKEHGEPNTDKD